MRKGLWTALALAVLLVGGVYYFYTQYQKQNEKKQHEENMLREKMTSIAQKIEQLEQNNQKFDFVLKKQIKFNVDRVALEIKSLTFDLLVSDDAVKQYVDTALNYLAKYPDADHYDWIFYNFNQVIDDITIGPVTESALCGYDKWLTWPVRDIVRQKGRDYLKIPDNLWNLYKSKKEVALNHLKTKQDQQNSLVVWLRSVQSGLEMFNNKKFLTAYKNWRSATTDVNKASELEDILVEMTDTPNITFWGGRRLHEGGPELVAMYAKIAADLAKELAASNKKTPETVVTPLSPDQETPEAEAMASDEEEILKKLRARYPKR